jgi:voltage-gated potassium channel
MVSTEAEAADETDASIPPWLQQVRLYLAADDLHNAVVCLLAELARAADNVQALHLLGNCYLAGGAGDCAHLCYSLADNISPQAGGPRLRLAERQAPVARAAWLQAAEVPADAAALARQLGRSAATMQPVDGALAEAADDAAKAVADPLPAPVSKEPEQKVTTAAPDPAPAAATQVATAAAPAALPIANRIVPVDSPPAELDAAMVHGFDVDLFSNFRETFLPVAKVVAVVQVDTGEGDRIIPRKWRNWLLWRFYRHHTLAMWRSFSSAYSTNDFVKYGLWAVLLIVASSLIQFTIQYDLFAGDVASDLGVEEAAWYDTLLHTIWYSTVTITTVGYGDVSPTSNLGKIFGIIFMILNFGVITVLSGTVASVLVAARLTGGATVDEDKYKAHTIICGWNQFVQPLLKIVDADTSVSPVVILINETSEDIVGRAIHTFKRLDVMHVKDNYTREEVLKKAFMERAATVIFVPDSSGLLPTESPDEQKTILAVLTAKGLAPTVNVVAHTTDPENVPHLQRAAANEIVVTDAYTANLLANHIVNPGMPQFVNHVFDPTSQNGRIKALELPQEMLGETHRKVFAYYKLSHNQLLLGYAVRVSGFDLGAAMGESGSSFIRDMINEQLEQSGVSLSTDEKVVVQVNPDDSYVVDSKHRALVLD